MWPGVVHRTSDTANTARLPPVFCVSFPRSGPSNQPVEAFYKPIHDRIELADGHAAMSAARRATCEMPLFCARVCVLHCTSTAAQDDGMMQEGSFRGLLLEFRGGREHTSHAHHNVLLQL